MLPGAWCPCGKFLVVDGHAAAAPGDLTMCPGRVCGEVLILAADRTLRRLTAEETDAVTRVELEDLYRAAEYGRRRRRRGDWIGGAAWRGPSDVK